MEYRQETGVIRTDLNNICNNKECAWARSAFYLTGSSYGFCYAIKKLQTLTVYSSLTFYMYLQNHIQI